MFSRAKFALVVSLLLCGNAAAQSVEEEKEHAVIAVGGAAFRRVTGDASSSFGSSVAVEVTPVKNWLELEFGTTALFRRHSTERYRASCCEQCWETANPSESLWGLLPAISQPICHQPSRTYSSGAECKNKRYMSCSLRPG
jgi:hypothetical protein